MNRQPDRPDPDDAAIDQLLREVGARDLPAADVMNEVRQAVHDEWRAMVEQRTRRNRFIAYGVAASVAVAALAVTISLQFTATPPNPVASVARVEGVLQLDPAGSGDWHAAKAGEQIAAGDMIRTDAGTRAALDFGNGVSVRVDTESLLSLAAADRVVLDHGGLYVDADPRVATQHPLAIETAYGSVRHLGTQYQVRTARNSIEVGIREGRIEITNASGTHAGAAGEQLIVQGEGAITRATISPQDERWQWATHIAPPFDIDHQPLADFLDWIARETGRQLVYATPEVQSHAQQLILRGSVSDLAPEQALAAVVATTPFALAETATTIQIQSGQIQSGQIQQ
jgi:ferric-dicitrate binding protein FerR (iron transport regulator)